jgi:hypothetical protein
VKADEPGKRSAYHIEVRVVTRVYVEKALIANVILLQQSKNENKMIFLRDIIEQRSVSAVKNNMTDGDHEQSYQCDTYSNLL